MKKLIALIIFFGVVIFCFFLLPSKVLAATCTATGTTGDWTSAATWTGCGSSGPVSGDTVIMDAATVTVSTADGTVAAASITFATTGGGGSTLTVQSGATVNVSGNITANGSATNSIGSVITGAGTVTAGSMVIGTTVSPSTGTTITIGASITTMTLSSGITLNAFKSGSKTCNPVFQLVSGTVSATGITTTGTSGTTETVDTGGVASGTLKLTSSTPWTQGSGTNTFSLNGTSTTVEYSGASPALLVTTYQNLVLSGSGTPTGAIGTINGNFTTSGTVTYNAAVGVTIGGNLTIGANTSFTGGGSSIGITVSGTTTISGTLSSNSTTGSTFTGLVTFNTGGSLAGAAPLTFQGGITNSSSGTVTFPNVNITFSTNNQIISGSQSIDFGTGTVTISGAITVTNSNTATVTVHGVLNGSVAGSTWTQGVNADTVYLSTSAQPMATGSIDASTNTPNTFEYSANGAQTIEPPTIAYFNLKLAGTGTATKTAGGSLTINGDFTIGGNATFAAGTALTHTLGGNLILNTTAGTSPYSFTTSGTIVFNTLGSPASTGISGSPTTAPAFNNITINNTSGFTVSTNISATGTMTVGLGATLTPSAGVVISGSGGTLTGSGTIQVTRTASTADLLNQYTMTTITFTNLTVDYIGTSAQTVNAKPYNNLLVRPGANSVTHTFETGTTTVSGNLTVGDGSHTADNVTAATNSTTLTVTGNLTIASGTTFIANSSNSLTISGNWTNNGGFTHSNGTVVFNGSGVSSNSGLTNAGTGTDGGTSWTNPGNITGAPNAVYASSVVNSFGNSSALQATNFGFSIPGGATITGITAAITRHESLTGIDDLSVELMKAGVAGGSGGSESFGWTTTDTTATYGSSSDLWGQSWTPSDINNTNFGLSLSVINNNSSSRTAYVDSIQLTVYYTTGGAQTLTGATTFYNFTDTTSGATLKFHAGDIFTFAHAFTITGSSSKVNIQSDTPSSQWKAHFMNAQPSSVTYATITDSGCDTGSALATVTAVNNDTNGGNNGACWDFVGLIIRRALLQGGAILRGGTQF